jgi:hypothetical protein
MIRSVMVLMFMVSMLIPGAASGGTQAEYFLDSIEPDRTIKSGTPLYMKLVSDNTPEARAFRVAASLADARESMDAFADSPDGLFRVHYDTSGIHAPDLSDTNLNGIPDYVDSALDYLDYAWKLAVYDLGYGTPLSDGALGGTGTGGQSLVDCYIKELASRRLYGFTMTDNFNPGPSTSYLTIDNDYTESIYSSTGYDALRVTTAHEFFHVIHYTYWGRNDYLWWMEQSAVWFEDFAWDDVNDYVHYVSFFFDNHDLTLDTSNGSFEYGAALFVMMLVEKHGFNLIRNIWEDIRSGANGDIELLDAHIPGGLGAAVSDLAVWAYFTGERANTEDFFSEASSIKETMAHDATHDASDTSGSLTLRHHAFKYVSLDRSGGYNSGESIRIVTEFPDGGTWSNRVILYESPGNYTVHDLPSASTDITIDRHYSRVVLVLANTDGANTTLTANYTMEVNPATGEKPTPYSFAVGQNYPNPFNAVTTIPYSIAERCRVTLKVYDIRGALAATLVDGTLQPGDHTVIFNGAGLASGTYVAVLKTDNATSANRMIILK